MRRAEKVEAVQELEGDLRRATVAVLADYRGLTAGQMTRLRKAVRDEGTVSDETWKAIRKIYEDFIAANPEAAPK